MGAATCRLLAQRGASVLCIADVSSKGFQQLKDSIAKINPSTQVSCSEVDVTSSAAVNKWMNDVVTKFGGIDGSANIAGRPQAVGIRKAPTILEETDEEWSKIMDVNMNGVLYCTRAQVQVMKDLPPKDRAIVNVASIASMQHIPDIYAYNVSKVACSWFSSSVAKDVQSLGIRVNTVLPGMSVYSSLTKTHCDHSANLDTRGN